MKAYDFRPPVILFLAALLLLCAGVARAQDYVVTAESFQFDYTINGTSGNPEVTLERGRSYTFAVTACACHPFEIRGAPPGSVTNNNTSNGTITFNVPLTEANYTYVCSIHLFGGTIKTVPPAAPTAIEAWRQLHFGTTANTGDAADMFDFDQDGLVNLVEFAFGLNPKLGSSLQLPAWQLQAGGFTASFTQPAGVDGVVYGAEWSTSLTAETWTVIPDTGTGEQHTFNLPVETRSKLFVRLTVKTPVSKASPG